MHFLPVNTEKGENNMRRLVAISSKTSKLTMALAALTLTFTSLHLAASARMASLRREQEALSHQPSAPSQTALSMGIQAENQKKDVRGASVEPMAGTTAQASHGPTGNAVAVPSNVPAAHRRQIVISIADRKLAVLEDGRLVKTYPIAVGTRTTPSPDGDFVVVNHAKDPIYRHRNKEIAPGKDNPLGTRWMGLSLKGYGIHGTNVQSSVGKASSHGCFRMRKQDVEELYTLVQVGDTVTVRRERDAMIVQVFVAPAAPAATLAAQTGNAGEVQVASATVSTVETMQQ
jgi:lipoprotein-anchoring transpeptidase ErfK/SrfK